MTTRGGVSNAVAGGLGTGGLVILHQWLCLRGDVVKKFTKHAVREQSQVLR